MNTSDQHGANARLAGEAAGEVAPLARFLVVLAFLGTTGTSSKSSVSSGEAARSSSSISVSSSVVSFSGVGFVLARLPPRGWVAGDVDLACGSALGLGLGLGLGLDLDFALSLLADAEADADARLLPCDRDTAGAVSGSVSEPSSIVMMVALPLLPLLELDVAAVEDEDNWAAAAAAAAEEEEEDDEEAVGDILTDLVASGCINSYKRHTKQSGGREKR